MSAKITFHAYIACAILGSALLTGCSFSPQAKEARALKRGTALLAKKDYPRALLEFRNASKAMPKDAEPYYQMGLTYSALGNVPAAASAFRKATELNPKHVDAQLKYSAMLTGSRNKELIEEASHRLEEVLVNSPGNADANNTLAIAEWELGHAQDATSRLEDVLQKFPDNLKASVALAKMKLSARDLPGAEDVLRKAVASAPKSPEAGLALSQLYWLSKQPEKAEAEIKRVLTVDPRNGPALASLASMQVAEHRMDEAEDTYKKLAALPAKEYKHLHAIFLFQTGKRDQALAEFAKLANEDPSDRNARSRLLAAYMALGKTTEAQQLLASALKKNAKDTDALFQRAEIYLKNGNAQAAETDLKQVLHFKADFPQAHYALAEVYRAEGSLQNERQELNETLRLNPSMLPARLALSRNFLVSNEAKSALDVLDQTPQQQKSILAVVVERNWTLFATGNLKEMRAVLDRALKVTRNPELLVQDAVLKMRDGDYVSARVDADEVLRTNPEDIRAARLLVDSYTSQKQPQKAAERLAELVQQRPNSAPLKNLLAQFYLATGKRAEARQAFEAAQAADPKFVAADLALANMDYGEKRLDQAKQRLTTILNGDPKNLTALLMMAGIESETGNRDAAITRYRAILNIDGANLFALNNLAYMLATDDPDEALKYAQQAGEVAPDDPAVQDTLGWVYYRKGIYKTAVDYFKNAVAKGATPRREFHLAMSYIKSGDRDLGQKTLNAALLKDPTLLKTEQGW